MGSGAAKDRFAAGQIVTVFRSRRRPEAEAAYQVTAADIEAAARAAPGFVDFKSFLADDGEHLSVITFDTLEDHLAWRNDPDHRRVQARGRDEFYREYSIQVAECRSSTAWTRTDDEESTNRVR